MFHVLSVEATRIFYPLLPSPSARTTQRRKQRRDGMRNSTKYLIFISGRQQSFNQHCFPEQKKKKFTTGHLNTIGSISFLPNTGLWSSLEEANFSTQKAILVRNNLENSLSQTLMLKLNMLLWVHCRKQGGVKKILELEKSGQEAEWWDCSLILYFSPCFIFCWMEWPIYILLLKYLDAS